MSATEQLGGGLAGMENAHPLPPLDGRALAAVIAAFSPEAALAWVGPRVAALEKFDAGLVRDLPLRWENAGADFESQLAPWIGPDSPWRESPSGQWLLGELWSARGRTAEALAMWDGLVGNDSVPREEAFLSRARLRRRTGDGGGALEDLRRAARLGRDYAFLARASRFLDRLRPEAAAGCRRTVRIAMVFSTTTDLIVPLLRLACFRDGIWAEIYQAPYGNLSQEILQAGSALYRFEPEVVIIGTHWRDAHLSAFAADRDREIRRVVDEFSGRWDALRSRRGCTVLQHGFDLPVFESGGQLSSSHPGGRTDLLRAINVRLREVRRPGVAVIDLERIAAEAGLDNWESPSLWCVAKQHPDARAIPALVDHYLALIRAQFGMSRKVLVLDLDNTLWGGVIGEDGIEGIEIGPPSAVGEAYAEFQRYALELKQRGVLLAVCSKNNEEEARLPFRQHDGMVLKEDDFVAFRANWKDKAENLRDLAQTLGLGLDSFVFVDDSPFERRLVERSLPEVAVVETGHDPASFVQSLHRGRYFESLALSPEDAGRHGAYLANVRRDEFRGAAANLDDFLRGLEMVMHHGDVGEVTLDRVAQLIGKTNQFNLTTRRHALARVEALMRDPACWTHWFRLEDRFGDNGIVGVLIAVPDAKNGEVLEVDTFLLSCRVIGRGAEEFMLAKVLAAAERAGRPKVRLIHVPTAKNGMVADWLARLELDAEAGYGGDGRAYVWDLRSRPAPTAPFIKDASPAAGPQPGR